MNKEIDLEEVLDIRGKVKLETDFYDEEGKPVVIAVALDVYNRAKAKLEEIGITPKKAVFGVVFVGAAAGVRYAIKKHRENKELGHELPDEKLDEFDILARNNRDKIFNYIYFKLGNRQEAEDITQKVFMRALLSFDRFKPREGLENPESSWLFAITRNLLKNYYRDTNRKNKKLAFSIDQSSDEYSSDPSMLAMHTEKRVEEINVQKKLHKAIRSLDNDEAIFIVYLKLYEELTNKDIAYIMEMTEGAVKSKYYRIINSLKNFVLLEELNR